MSCIIKINETKSMMTETELLIADFILGHKKEIIGISVQALAEMIPTSSAAIIRFSKKVGFKGFSEFKIGLAQDLTKDSIEFNNVLVPHESMDVLIKKAHQSNLQTIEKTYGLINSKKLDEIVKKIMSCRNIYLFGVGGSGIVCEDFQNKLLRIGKTSLYYLDVHLQLTAVPNMQKEDLAFFISYSGKTKEIITAAKWVKKMGISSVAMTQSAHNELGKLVDQVITIPIEEQELRIGATSSRLSSLIIVDLLYYGIVSHDTDEVHKRIVDTREIINEIQK